MDFDDAMLEVAWKNLEIQTNKYKDMDSKAIAITTITGVLVSFLIKSDTVFKLKSDSQISLILFLLTVFSFLLTVLFSILVMRVRYGKILSSKLLLEELYNKKDEYRVKKVIGTIAEIEDDIRKKCDKKGDELSRAVITLGISVILLILYSISVFI